MSEETEADTCCASCGIPGCDVIKLKECDGCDLVRYCSDACQQNHKSEHKEDCKKRAAELLNVSLLKQMNQISKSLAELRGLVELRDALSSMKLAAERNELLFKQPESSHLGDCPICCLPLPIDSSTTESSTIYSCCSKVVCHACVDANELREKEERLSASCPFCRHSKPPTKAESKLLNMKRVEANDPAALESAAMDHFNAGDYATAVEYWEKAAGLGWVTSHHHLSLLFGGGFGVAKDPKKYQYHIEQAAIGGHPIARHNLAVSEDQKGNIGKAVKHYIIAANLGLDESLEQLKEYYRHGMVSKEDFADALRAHQAAVDATKSPERDRAKRARMSTMGNRNVT